MNDDNASASKDKKRALSLFREGSFPEAEVCLQKVCREHPLDHGAWLLHGLCLQNMGMLDRAIPLLEYAVKLKPMSAEAHDKLGFACFQKGWLGPALDSFREALRLNRDLVVAHDHLIKALLASAHYHEAIAAS